MDGCAYLPTPATKLLPTIKPPSVHQSRRKASPTSPKFRSAIGLLAALFFFPVAGKLANPRSRGFERWVHPRDAPALGWDQPGHAWRVPTAHPPNPDPPTTLP